ncbi:MAG: hypothetical protein M3Y49_19045, partial [Actinomycetota bacterium]|nr:hypothetical protein [Actinomycetota bacterium]
QWQRLAPDRAPRSPYADPVAATTGQARDRLERGDLWPVAVPHTRRRQLSMSVIWCGLTL